MTNSLAKRLGEFLRKERGGATYQEFSRKVGLSDSTLHRLELGQQNVTLRTLEQISRRLKKSVPEIFS